MNLYAVYQLNLPYAFREAAISFFFFNFFYCFIATGLPFYFHFVSVYHASKG